MNAQELEKLRKKYAVIVLIAFFAWIAAVVLSIANFDTWGLSFSTLKIGWLTGLFIVYVLFAKLRKKICNTV